MFMCEVIMMENFCGNCEHFKYAPDGKGIIYRCKVYGTTGNNMLPIDCKQYKGGD